MSEMVQPGTNWLTNDSGSLDGAVRKDGPFYMVKCATIPGTIVPFDAFIEQ